MGENYYDKLAYGDSVPSADIEYVGRETAEPQNFLKPAIEEAMVPFALQRMWERRSSQYEVDKEWKIDEDLGKELKKEYRQEDEDYLRESGSKEEFTARRQFISEDQKRLQAMASGGWYGGAALLGFSLIDPVNIGVSLATGGIGILQKGSGLARAAKIGLASGLENVAIDSVLMQGSTQSKASDLIISFGAGAVIGAGIGALTRGKNPKLAKEVDAADAAAQIDSDNFIVKGTVGEAGRDADLPLSKTVPGVDARAVQSRLTAYAEKLKRNIGGSLAKVNVERVKNKIKDLQAKVDVENRRIKKTQLDLTTERTNIAKRQAEFIDKAAPERAKIEARHADAIAKQEVRLAKVEKKVAKKPGDNKQAAKLWKEEVELERLKRAREEDLKGLDRRLSRKVKRAEAKFKRAMELQTAKANATKAKLEASYLEHQARLDRASQAKESAVRLKDWNNMDEAQRVKAVYGDEALPMKKAELKRQIEGYSPVRVATPEPSTIPPVTGVEPGSVGAAKAGQPDLHRIYDLDFESQKRLSQYAYDGSNIPEDLRGRRLSIRSKITDAMHSAQAMISNSKDYAIRGFGYHLFEAPQGGTAAKVTVAARVKNYGTQIRSAMRNRLNEGLEEWGKENGISRFATLMKQDNFKSYHKAVMIEVKNPGTYQSPAIIKGAKGVREQFRVAGEIRKDAGEAGFGNIDMNNDYIPIILNETAIKNALHHNHESKVVDLLSLGYQRGRYALDKKLADRIADAYILRAKNHSLTMSDAVRMSTDADVKDLADQLRKAGVDKDTVDDFLDLSLEKELKQHMSHRAKKSLEPEIDVEYKGLKFIDLVDNDLPKLLESYTREASGGAAFAKLGFKTRRDIFDFLIDLEKASNNNGFNPHEIAKEVQILRDGVDMAYGRSLNENAHSPFVRNLSRLRDLTGLLRLQFVGAASIPELARVTAQRSLSSVLDAIPELGVFRGTKNLRKGGKYSGKFSDENLNELEQVMGYVGEDHVLYPNGLRADDLEEAEVTSRLGTYFDNAVAQGRRLQEVASGFRMIQGSGEKIAVRTLANDIKKWAIQDGKALSKSNIDRAGWSDGFLDDVKKFMRENPASDDYKGKKVTLFNFGKMTPEMQERLQIGMHRLVMADMQRPMIGETPMFMNKWMGQTLTQFRSFSILSMEKQLVHDFRHDRAMGGIIALHSAMMSYMATGIASMQRNVGKDNMQERIEKDMTGSNVVVNVINRMGQLAAVGICADTMATFGLLPDSLVSSRDQAGARAMTTGTVPILGLTQDLLQAPKAVADVIKGKEGKTRGSLASDAVKEIQDVLPFGKAIGINQAINVLRGSLDD